MNWKLNEKKYLNRLKNALKFHEAGKITKSLGLVYEAYLPGAGVGSQCKIYPSGDAQKGDGVECEVIGFRDKRVLLMPFEDVPGVNNDSQVVLSKKASSYRVSPSLLGRVLDGKGNPIDGKGPLRSNHLLAEERRLYGVPSHPLSRDLIREPLDLGVRAINGVLTCGQGQRVGIMAGSGVGKSVLLGMMAKSTSADVNVITLIGERGREVREFIERDLGEEGLKRSVIIVATSDKSPLLRTRAAFLGKTIAEYFRDQGKNVLFLADSITRFSMAQREIGLAMGEPPTSKGYTPSVFSMMAKLLERAGTAEGGGSITGLYTVLVEGDEMDDPISDSARSILDGHIVLSRKLAEKNHFPAIDVLQSNSRVMNHIVSAEHKYVAGQIKELLAVYREAEDLINIGAYVKGSNPKIDLSIALNSKIISFLKQGMDEKISYGQTLAELKSIQRAIEANTPVSPTQVNVAQA